MHRIALHAGAHGKPVIAAITGDARRGCDMKLMCDLRVMGLPATLAESYIDIG